MCLYVPTTQKSFNKGIKTVLFQNKRLTKQVLKVEISVANITSRLEMIMAQLGLQEKVKGEGTAAGHDARVTVSLQAFVHYGDNHLIL